jgi:hypothetical protein
VTVVATEINVVASRRLWPRALLTPFTDRVTLTSADERAYTGYAGSEQRKGSRSSTSASSHPRRSPAQKGSRDARTWRRPAGRSSIQAWRDKIVRIVRQDEHLVDLGQLQKPLNRVGTALRPGCGS